MGIRRKVRFRRQGAAYDTDTDTVTTPVMSYTNAGLAELIVRAWNNDAFNWPAVPGLPPTSLGSPGFPGWPAGSVPKLRKALLERDTVTKLPTADAVMVATNAVNILAKMDLQRAVVITEAEHDDDYTMQADNEVVFVLPDETRAVFSRPIAANTPAGLLETAKLLMACTPNGI
jgi:hypothetical protein